MARTINWGVPDTARHSVQFALVVGLGAVVLAVVFGASLLRTLASALVVGGTMLHLGLSNTRLREADGRPAVWSWRRGYRDVRESSSAEKVRAWAFLIGCWGLIVVAYLAGWRW